MLRIVLSILLILPVVSAVAQTKPAEGPQSVCNTGDPWFLPAAPAKMETSMLVVASVNTLVQVRLCNCATQQDGQTYLWVNPTASAIVANRSEPGKGKGKVDTQIAGTSASKLYGGSCLDAVTNILTIRNTLPKPQNGTYLIRGIKADGKKD